MTADLFGRQAKPRPRLFLLFLVLFLIGGSVLSAAVTGADYVSGNGRTTAAEHRTKSTFSLEDDRRILLVLMGEDKPTAFCVWHLSPARATMSVTVYPSDWRGAGSTLCDRFGDGGRIGCEAVCGALTATERYAPRHYIVIDGDTVGKAVDRLDDTLTLWVPAIEAEPTDTASYAVEGGTQTWTGGQLSALLKRSVSAYAEGKPAYTRLRGDLIAALLSRYGVATRAEQTAADFAALVNETTTDLSISHFVAYRQAWDDLLAKNSGAACSVLVIGF